MDAVVSRGLQCAWCQSRASDDLVHQNGQVHSIMEAPYESMLWPAMSSSRQAFCPVCLLPSHQPACLCTSLPAHLYALRVSPAMRQDSPSMRCAMGLVGASRTISLACLSNSGCLLSCLAAMQHVCSSTQRSCGGRQWEWC